MLPTRLQRRAAFTLLEVVLVVVIIFLLIIAIIPAFRPKPKEMRYSVRPSATATPRSGPPPSVLDLKDKVLRATPVPAEPANVPATPAEPELAPEKK